MINKNRKKNYRSFLFYTGVLLILIGILLLSLQSVKDKWNILFVVPIIGIILIIGGINYRKFGLLIAGSQACGLGFALAIFFTEHFYSDMYSKIGLSLFSIGLGWCLIPVLSSINSRNNTWWSFIPGELFFSTGLCFFFQHLKFIDFVLYLTTCTGIAFLILGLVKKWLGFLIPGCLMLGIGPGVYIPWNSGQVESGLAQTGIMLVCFALGFILIILFSRVSKNIFIWWPLIPGGVLFMVGWGLYIGGNPNNALSFIGNTGSIGLIILGAYLLLLRQGFHK